MKAHHDTDVPEGYEAIAASGRPDSKLDGLTSLRFFAATMIVVQHSMGFLGVSESTAWHLPLHQGVSFFFVLSGFILAYVYRDDWTPARRMRFFVARFARIYPVHLLGFVLVLVLLPRGAWILGERADVPAALANLLVVQSWIPIWHFFASFNSPSWSISTEFLFYLAFPLLIVWPPRVAVLATLMLALATVAIAVAFQLPYGGAGDSVVTANGLLYNHPLPRLFEFAIGIFTQSLWRGRKVAAPSIGRATALEILSVAAVCLSIYFSPPLIQQLTREVPTSWAVAIGTYLGGTFSAIPFAILIYLVACETGVISRALLNPLAVRLGEISFVLYMIHGTLFIFYDVHKAAFADAPLALRYGFYWCFLLLASWIIWFHVEVPARSRILAWYAARAGRAGRATPGPRPASGGYFSRTPSRPGIGLKAIGRLFALYLMCVAVGYAIGHPPSSIRRVSEPSPTTGAGPGLLLRPVAFGDRLRLLRASIRQDSDGRYRLDLLWQSQSDQRLDYTVAVHLLDGTHTIVAQADYPQDTAHSMVRAGELWEDTRALPVSTAASLVGIAVFKDRDFLRAMDGQRDWDGRRLLLPFPQGATGPEADPRAPETSRPASPSSR